VSLLAVSVGRTGVVAAVDGSPPVAVLLPAAPMTSAGPAEGRGGWEATDVWRAVLDAADGAVRGSDVPATGLVLTTTAPSTAVWDAESLGAARPVVPLPGGPALTAVREREAHTWALLLSGRCAVGDLGGYLVARMTRGLWQVTATPVSLPAGLLEEVPEGLRSAAQPWPGPGVVRTDPAAFAGLELPIVGLAAVADSDAVLPT
jgi:glycerol kinase